MGEKKNLKISTSYKWLKLSFIKSDKTQNIFWILPKKHIPLAVTRNRLKRWGRLFLAEQAFFKMEKIVKQRIEGEILKEEIKKKKEFIRGDFLIIALKEKKNFYKNLKRKEFDHVFKTAFTDLFLKIQTKERFQKQKKTYKKEHESR